MVPKVKVAPLIVGIAIVLSFIRAYYVERYGGPVITRYERIEIKGTSVTNSTHTYFVTIDFVNNGLTDTSIESLSLNGVPYDDTGWTGTVRPVVFGDVTPGTVIEVGSSYRGMVIFSDDCEDPKGRNLIVVGENSHYVHIAIHTTGGKDYDALVVLSWNCYPKNSLCPASTLAIATVAVVASAALFITVRRRATTIKYPVKSTHEQR